MNVNNAIFDARSWTDIIWMTFGGLTVWQIAFRALKWDGIGM